MKSKHPAGYGMEPKDSEGYGICFNFLAGYGIRTPPIGAPLPISKLSNNDLTWNYPYPTYTIILLE